MVTREDIGQSTNCYHCGCHLKGGAGFSMTNNGPDYCAACSKNVELCKSCGKEEYFEDGYQDTYPYYCSECNNSANQEKEYEKRFLEIQRRFIEQNTPPSYSINKLIRLFYKFNDSQPDNYNHISKMVRTWKYYRSLKGLDQNDNIIQLAQQEAIANGMTAIAYISRLERESRIDEILSYLTKWHNHQAMTGYERIRADMANAKQDVDTCYHAEYVKKIDLSLCLLSDDKSDLDKVF